MSHARGFTGGCVRDGEREGGQFLATENWRKREVVKSEVECSNPGSTTFYKMIDFVLFNTFFRFQLKYTRRFSFQNQSLFASGQQKEELRYFFRIKVITPIFLHNIPKILFSHV